jgi:hypothetical protein
MSQIVLNLTIPSSITVSGGPVTPSEHVANTGAIEEMITSASTRIIDVINSKKSPSELDGIMKTLSDIKKSIEEMTNRLGEYMSLATEVATTAPTIPSTPHSTPILSAYSSLIKPLGEIISTYDNEEEEEDEVEVDAEVGAEEAEEEVDADEEEAEEEEVVEEVEEVVEETEEDAEEEVVEEDAEEEVVEETEEEDVVEEAEAEEATEEEEELVAIEFRGVTYYKDAENNIYGINDEGELSETPVGIWNTTKSIVQFYKK